MSERTLVLATVEEGRGFKENISSCFSGERGVKERTLVLATVEGEVSEPVH